MSKELIVDYVNILNIYQINPNIKLTEDQMDIVDRVKKEAEINTKLSSFLSQIHSIQDPMDRIKFVNENMSEQKEIESNILYDSDNEIEISKPKVKVYENKKAGYVDVLFLSLITGFLGGILTTLTMLFLK